MIEPTTGASASLAPVELQAHIAGWKCPGGGVEIRNPADTRELVAAAPSLGVDALDVAIDVANDAAPRWRITSVADRTAVLARAADEMMSRADEIATAMTREMGKLLTESQAEVRRSADILRYFSQAPKLLDGRTFPLGGSGESAFTIRVPLGVVGLITPWNFPLAIPTWKTAAALAFGNAAVLKPSELSPWSAVLLVECLLDAGLPAEVLGLVPGAGSLLGPALVDSPLVAGISFTGSTAAGRQVAQRAARAGTATQCEMGGRNAVVVLADADLGDAVRTIVAAGFGTTGQRCTASSRVIVERPIAAELAERLVAATCALSVGPGLDRDSDVGPLVGDAQRTAVLDALERARAEGTDVLCGGRRLDDGPLAHGYFMSPAVTRGPAESWFAGHEVFGPVVSLFEARDYDEAVRLNNAVDYGLTAAIHTRSLEHAMRFVHESETGMVHVNRPTVGAEPHVPFGGAGASSIGPRELGGAHEFFTTSRSAHVRRM